MKCVAVLILYMFLLPVVGAETEVNANPEFTFTPRVISVQPGDSVRFSNRGGFHNVVADDGSFRCADGCDGEGGDGAPAGQAWSFSRRFTVPGSFPYHWEVHGGTGGLGMSGMIVVEKPRSFRRLSGYND